MSPWQKVHVDFETRGTIDLPKVGIDNYSRHPGTDVWCMAYAFDDEPVRLWTPEEGNIPEELNAHLAQGGIFVAHNTSFEFHIWNNVLVERYGAFPLRLEQCTDTCAMAYAMALPGSLDGAAAAVGLEFQKDNAGKRLMLQMCRPRGEDATGSPTWWDDMDRRFRLYDYCVQDVEVERALDNRLLQLTQGELALWREDQRINIRGVPVDLAAIEGAQRVVKEAKASLDEQMHRVTDGWVTACSNVNQLTDWLRSNGVETKGVAKADLAELLRGELEPAVREAIRLRQSAAKTSTAKLSAMEQAASEDGRVRGTTQYHGAGTGRWAGRKIQVQNFPRPSFEQNAIEAAVPLLEAGDTESIDLLYGEPMEVVSSCLRAMIKAPDGNTFVAADWSNIEGRGLAWLAGEEAKLEVFRAYDEGRGEDPYVVAAENVEALVPSMKGRVGRQGGKVCELGLGYQGGVGAFQSMAAIYQFFVPDETAEVIKTAWREAHPNIVQWWYDLEAAAMDAVASPGAVFSAGPADRAIKFRVNGSFLWGRLPSGRVLCYPYPEIQPVDTPWGDIKDAVTYMTINQKTRKWSREKTYGGKLAENFTQAAARDILANTLMRCAEAHLPVVMHVHDEVVVEVGEPDAPEALKDLLRIMAEPPTWAQGLPLVAEGWIGPRFRK